MKKILHLIMGIRNIYVNPCLLLKNSFVCAKEIVSADSLQVTGTGVLQLYFPTHILKIPLGEFSQCSLEKEFQNYQDLKNVLPTFVDYSLVRYKNGFRVDKLKKAVLNENILQDIVLTLEKLENHKNREEEPNLSLDLLNGWCKQRYAFYFKYKKCPMHGDLTPKNIMQNNEGKMVLIDLDRFTFNGIKGIDKLHFIIEKECKESGIDFFDWIQKYLDDWDDRNLLFLYFVYRINTEHFDNVKLPDIYYEKTCNVYNKFMKRLS